MNRFFKTMPIVITLACAVFLSACATNFAAFINGDNQLRLKDGLSIKAAKVTADMDVVQYNWNNYEVKEKSKAIAGVDLNITNSGDIDYEFTELQNLELVFTGDYETIDFVQQQRFWLKEKTSLFGLKNEKVMKILPKGKTIKDTLFFVHSKGQVPVALVNNRMDRIIFFDDSDAKYNAILAALEKEKNVHLMLGLAERASFETVNDFREAHDITINASNRFGYNLLITGLAFGNDSVFYGALKNGGDVHILFHSSEGEIKPLHLAVLTKNTGAIKALVEAGADINSDTGILPAALAVKHNDLATLKFLYELGANLKDLKIPMAWSDAKPAISYAEDRNMTEIAGFLESIRQ